MSSRKAPRRVNLLQPRRAILTTLQPRRAALTTLSPNIIQPRRVALLCKTPPKAEKIIYIGDGESYLDVDINTRVICGGKKSKSSTSGKTLTQGEYENLLLRVKKMKNPLRSDLDLLEKENKRRQAKRQDDIYSKWENIGDIEDDDIIDFGAEEVRPKKRRKTPKKKSPKKKSLRQLCLEKKKDGYIWVKGPDGYTCRKKKTLGKRTVKKVQASSPRFTQWLSARKGRWRELRKKRKERKKTSFRMRSRKQHKSYLRLKSKKRRVRRSPHRMMLWNRFSPRRGQPPGLSPIQEKLKQRYYAEINANCKPGEVQRLRETEGLYSWEELERKLRTFVSTNCYVGGVPII